MALPAGSTRARVTTANAEWARAAEHRDRCQERLAAARAAHTPTVSAPVVAVPAYEIKAGDRIELAGVTYDVRKVGVFMIHLRGPRGGAADLVQNAKNPHMWSLVKGVKSTWFKRADDGTFAIF